jgi:hypothetical protein
LLIGIEVVLAHIPQILPVVTMLFADAGIVLARAERIVPRRAP